MTPIQRVKSNPRPGDEVRNKWIKCKVFAVTKKLDESGEIVMIVHMSVANQNINEPYLTRETEDRKWGNMTLKQWQRFVPDICEVLAEGAE